MSLLRLKSWLLMGALVLTLSSVALAQKIQPFGPVDFEEDRQPFAPPDVSEYDLGPPERNGLFVSFERLYWSIGAPDRAEVGAPGVINPTDFIPIGNVTTTGIANTLSTSFLTADFDWGNRMDFGYRDGKHGWLATIFDTNSQDQELTGPAHPAINVNDPQGLLFGYVFGIADPTTGLIIPIPRSLEFTLVNVQNVTRLNGVELLHTYRFNPGRWGGEWEFYCGARYMQLNDSFNVTTFSFASPVSQLFSTSLNDGSFWNTLMENHMVGPELGLRMANRRERWTFVTEGRFTAAANFIDGHQNGQFLVNAFNLATNNSFLTLGNTAFDNSIHEESFSPIVELRLESSYELTKSIAFKFGYTALWMDNIARASNRVLYQVPDMGFNHNKHEDLLVDGVTFGIEINR